MLDPFITVRTGDNSKREKIFKYEALHCSIIHKNRKIKQPNVQQ